jgi:hypothetical protein
MKTRLLATLFLAVTFASTLSAQANNPAGPRASAGNNEGGSNAAGNSNRAGSAGDDWAALSALAKSGGTPKRGERSSRADAVALHTQQVADMRSVTEAARAFYTRYPTDGRAAEARKMEAIAGLRGVVAEDQAHELAAVAVATAYRVDQGVPAKDRLDVAIAMENQGLALKVRSGLVSDRGEEQMKVIRSLRAEFGPLAELDSYAVATARRSDPKTAHALASEVVRSTAVVARDMREAKAIKDRCRLLGHSINLSVPLADGGECNLGTERGHVTIVVVWSPRRPEALDPLSVFGKTFPRGTQVVALALGGTANDAKRISRTLPVLTKSAFAPFGPATRSVGDALKVHISPYVYVLNRSGVLTDFGTIDELPDVLTRAGVTKRKTS